MKYLPIQEWFMKKGLKDKNHFNHSFLIRVQGKIDKEKLKMALEKLSRLHDMLRAEFHSGGQWLRKESNIAELRELDIAGKTEEAIHSELTGWQNGFDLEKGYVWQSGIIRGYEDGSERIFFAAHHMVIDVASWGIIREDLNELYEGKKIETRGSSYLQWVETVESYGIHATDEEKRYWEEINGEQEKQQSQWAKLAQADDSKLWLTRVAFAQDMQGKLLRACNPTGNRGISDLLLSGLAYALYEVSGNKNNWITLEKQGREEIDNRLDVSRTVGWFTTMFPVCLTVGKDIGETVVENSERIRNIPHNGIGYGAIHGYDALPKILFNYVESVGRLGEDDWWICLGETSGEGMSPDNRYGNIVDMNGLGTKGRMGLWVESCLKEENHKRLCEAFKRNTEAIATYYEEKE